jgi:hypothetical protein
MYFWRITWPNFWNSPLGKGVSIGIAILAVVLGLFVGKAALIGYFRTLVYGAGFFAAGATIAGFRNIDQGNSFFEGFENFINENWSQSLAITAAIYIVALGAGVFVRESSPQCFKAGTLVSTATGYKEIEDIEVGDKVWAYDEETGQKALKEVVRLFRNGKEFVTNVTKDIGEGVKEWIKLGISSLKNNDLNCTAGHPFYVLNAIPNRTTVLFEGKEENRAVGSLIASKDLRIGDELLFSN